tara:strand:- start:5020 stop:8565 length:3546 start_codon:yes stop_codon:yes gene_type:complete
VLYILTVIDTHITAHTKRTRIRAVAFYVLSVMFFCGISQQAFAQDQNTLTLEDNETAYNIAPYSYVSIDEGKGLSPETLIKRHNNNLRGKKQQTDLINLENTQHAVWIIFSVNNKTKTSDWVLHFGDAIDGRMGMIKTISVLNQSTKQSVSFPAAQPDEQSPFLGSALSLNIKPGIQNTFIIQLEAQKGLPLVFKPTLVPQITYMRMLLKGDPNNIIVAFLFIGIIFFFMASFYIGRNKASIALMSYYTVLCALFFNLNAYIVPDLIINGTLLFWLYMSSFILLIIASKFFSKLTYDHRPMENIALIVLTLFIIAAVLSYSFLAIPGTTGLTVIVSTICACLLLLATITYFTNDKSPLIIALFCTGLLLAGAALALLTAATFGIISPVYIPYFWSIHLIQGMCFMVAYLQSNVHRKHRKIHETEHQMRDDQSLARLQKSKDSADQARLLRVIERERELMSELREREIKRTEEMRASKETADKANQAKSAFLAVVSHEIRTPMNGILGMVQLLQSTSLSKTQNDYVDIIRKSGDTMMALLNDILDFEKIERGSMEVETVNFDLRKLIQDIIILMSGHASQKNVGLNSTIEGNIPPIVSGDPTRLRQVLLNLVNNGLKFTEKGEVIIKVSMIDDSKKTIRFEVQDTGIGISEEAQRKLFTPFTQAETSISRKYGGTGLGLAISYRLIKAMGGGINVDSVTGSGSTFFFELDMEQLQTGLPDNGRNDIFDPENKREYNTKPMRILVTEDNEMNRKVLDGLLSQQGHTLYMAANGLEALDLCRKHQPELVLMDIQMDGLSGLETTKRLRADPNKDISSIPVVALTGNVMLEDIEAFFAAGMNGFLAKPIDSKQLNELLHNASIGKFENDISDKSIDTDRDIFADSPNDTTIAPAPIAQPLTAQKPNKVTQDKGIDLANVPTNLSFDEREHFVSDSALSNSSAKIKPMRDDDVMKSADKKPEETTESTMEKKDKPAAAQTASVGITTSSSAKEKSSFKRNAPDDEMTEIQRYLMEQHSSHQPAQEPKAPTESANTPPSPDKENTIAPAENNQTTPSEVKDTDMDNEPQDVPETEPLINKDMLQSLIDTLGKEQFMSLLEGFLNKATEIIDDLQINIEESNIAALGARAHELKGMTGNFGMTHVSNIAGHVERAAKLSQESEAIKQAKKLSAANDQTRAALLKWAEQ